MRRRRAKPSRENHERWLVSYADFVTLLFAFFVLLFASAEADHGKVARVSASVRRALEDGRLTAVLAGLIGSPQNRDGTQSEFAFGDKGDKSQRSGEADQRVVELLPSLERLQAALSREIADGQLEVSMGTRGLTISLHQAAYFPSGEDKINEAMLPSLAKLAAAINKIPNPIRLEGHTDSVPIRNSRFKSNWELSAARAIAVLETLSTRFGVPMERMAIIGYADTSPVDNNETDTGRARNRRVDIVVLNERGLKTEPDKPQDGPSSSYSNTAAGAAGTSTTPVSQPRAPASTAFVLAP